MDSYVRRRREARDVRRPSNISHMDPWFQARRDQQLRAFEQANPAIAELVREMDAIYLFGTIGMEAMMRADGSVIVRIDEDWDRPAPRPEPLWRPATNKERTASLVIAGERIPAGTSGARWPSAAGFRRDSR